MATVSLDKYDELKAKFLRVDRSYESLKSLSRKAISEFEDLRNRYKQLGKNFQKEKQDHEETKNKLNDNIQEHEKLREKAMGAFDQYGHISAKLEEQQEMTRVAEQLATQLSHKVKVLESQLALSKEGDSSADSLEKENAELKKEITDYREYIEKLEKSLEEERITQVSKEEEMVYLKKKIEAFESDAAEREGMVMIEADAMDRIRKASELALEEMKAMSTQLEEERARRIEVERLAQHSVNEMQAARRQSAILMSGAVDQQQLLQALSDIEALNTKLAEAKSQHKEEVEHLELQVGKLKENTLLEEITKLEEKLTLLSEEAENQSKRAEKAESEVNELKEKLKTAAADEPAGGPPAPPPPAGGPPPPPPPPPCAPPPPPPPPTLQPIKNLITVKKAPSPPKDEPKADPMVEMLERIKKGNVQLRRVDTDPPKSGAGSGGVMAEMASLLSSGKPLRKGGRVPPPVEPKKPSVSAELAAKLNKRRRQQGEEETDGKKKAKDPDSQEPASSDSTKETPVSEV